MGIHHPCPRPENIQCPKVRNRNGVTSNEHGQNEELDPARSLLLRENGDAHGYVDDRGRADEENAFDFVRVDGFWPGGLVRWPVLMGFLALVVPVEGVALVWNAFTVVGGWWEVMLVTLVDVKGPCCGSEGGRRDDEDRDVDEKEQDVCSELGPLGMISFRPGHETRIVLTDKIVDVNPDRNFGRVRFVIIRASESQVVPCVAVCAGCGLCLWVYHCSRCTFEGGVTVRYKRHCKN